MLRFWLWDSWFLFGTGAAAEVEDGGGFVGEGGVGGVGGGGGVEEEVWIGRMGIRLLG